MSLRRVVITGLGALTSMGHDVPTLWNGLLEGKSGISVVDRFSVEQMPVKIAGQIRNFEIEKYLDRRSLNRTDTVVQYGIWAAEEATRDAGLNPDSGSFNFERFGCIVGSGIGGLQTMTEQDKNLIERGPRRVSPMLVPKMMINAVSGELAIRFGYKGPVYTTVSACASANHAVGMAYQAIVMNQADVVLSGGSEAALVPLGFAGFCSARAMSKRNDDPERASRPFDRDRDGFVFGEGAAMLMLEELEHAKARGAKIYAEMIGFGMSCDAFHITQPSESGEGASRAMKIALDSAQVNPSDVKYINAHGTSTLLGDIAETKAVKNVFGDHAAKLAISSTKSMCGHLLGASGGVEAVVLAKSVETNKIHQTLNLENPDEQCDLDYVPGATRETDVSVAMSNSFGFGGHNTSIVFKAYDGS